MNHSDINRTSRTGANAAAAPAAVVSSIAFIAMVWKYSNENYAFVVALLLVSYAVGRRGAYPWINFIGGLALAGHEWLEKYAGEWNTFCEKIKAGDVVPAAHYCFEELKLPLLLVISAIGLTWVKRHGLKEEAEDRELREFTEKASISVQLHRIVGSGAKRGLAWSPILHKTVVTLGMQAANVKIMKKALDKPRKGGKKGDLRMGDLCLIDFDEGSNSRVVADLRDLIAAALNCPYAALPPKQLEGVNVVMAVTNEELGSNSRAVPKTRVLLATEQDLETIRKARAPFKGAGHSGGTWQPEGIAYAHGTYSSFTIVRWRQLEKMAQLWFQHKKQVAAHFSALPAPENNYDGTKRDALGASRIARRARRSDGKNVNKDFYWFKKFEHDDPLLTSFTLLRPK